MRDGALLVSDDYNGILYRVSYAKWMAAPAAWRGAAIAFAALALGAASVSGARSRKRAGARPRSVPPAMARPAIP